jgi:hypothetical protein
VSKWRFLTSIFKQGNREKLVGGDNSHVVFGKKFPWLKKEMSDGVLS